VQEIDMTRTKQFAAVFMTAFAAMAAATLQAQERPLTRAEVRAELARARASGELQRMQSDYGPAALQQVQPSTPHRAKDGTLGRSYASTAPAAVNGAVAVAVPMGDEGE
jgi:hypothetical protein